MRECLWYDLKKTKQNAKLSKIYIYYNQRNAKKKDKKEIHSSVTYLGKGILI